MSRYPEDLLVEPVKAAANEKLRLESQLRLSTKPTFGVALADPKDNPLYNIDKPKVVTPAYAQQSAEVLARHTAATALSLPKGSKVNAEANIKTVKDAFGIVDPVPIP